MSQFWRADLWPISTLLSYDLQEVLSILKGFQHCYDTKDYQCDNLLYDIDVKNVTTFLEGELEGLYLKCVRKGEVTVEEGNCPQPKAFLCDNYLVSVQILRGNPYGDRK